MNRWIPDNVNCHRILDLNPWADYDMDEVREILETRKSEWKDQFDRKSNSISVRSEGWYMLNIVPKLKRVIDEPMVWVMDRNEARNIVKSLSHQLLRECITTRDGVHHVFSNAVDDFIYTIGWESLEPEDVLRCIDAVDTPPTSPFPANTASLARHIMFVGFTRPEDVINYLVTCD